MNAQCPCTACSQSQPMLWDHQGWALQQPLVLMRRCSVCTQLLLKAPKIVLKEPVRVSECVHSLQWACRRGQGAPLLFKIVLTVMIAGTGACVPVLELD